MGFKECHEIHFTIEYDGKKYYMNNGLSAYIFDRAACYEMLDKYREMDVYNFILLVTACFYKSHGKHTIDDLCNFIAYNWEKCADAETEKVLEMYNATQEKYKK